MSLLNILTKEWNKKVKRGWDCIYIAVDLHDTIFESNYNGLALKIYDDAIECMQLLTKRKDICLIMFTSSYPKDIEQYIIELQRYDIKFDFINENPKEISNRLSDFSSKFYYNILLDDKAGFDPYIDFNIVKRFFEANY